MGRTFLKMGFKTTCKLAKNVKLHKAVFITQRSIYDGAFTAHKKLCVPLRIFFSKRDQIRSFLWIWSLLPKLLIENFILCAVFLLIAVNYFLEKIVDLLFIVDSL